MERTISVEERIRRAEEIYNRKKENEGKTIVVKQRKEKKTKKSSLIKMRNQMILSIIIYLTFYFLLNSNYEISKNIKTKKNEILLYDIDFKQITEETSKWWEATINTIQKH